MLMKSIEQYKSPQMEIVELELEQVLLAASNPESMDYGDEW